MSLTYQSSWLSFKAPVLLHSQYHCLHVVRSNKSSWLTLNFLYDVILSMGLAYRWSLEKNIDCCCTAKLFFFCSFLSWNLRWFFSCVTTKIDKQKNSWLTVISYANKCVCVCERVHTLISSLFVSCPFFVTLDSFYLRKGPLFSLDGINRRQVCNKSFYHSI